MTADGYSAIGLAEFTAEFDVELSFKEGEALTVLNVPAPEGWLMARNASGKEGLVPESYLGEGGGGDDGGGYDIGDGAADVGLSMGGGGFTVDGRGRMLADFVAEADGEMSVSAGEVVTLLMPAEGLPEGWLYGQLGNKEGLVPESYVERLGASESGSERVSGGLGLASDADSGMPDFDDDALGAAYDDAFGACLLYTSPSPRDRQKSRMPSSA